MLTTAPSHAAVATGRFNRILSATAAAACVALAAYKFFLTGRLNVNWDEFYYLNFVHALKRGDLNVLMQGAYTHLFAWLPAMAGDEMAQILAARVVMVVLLCVTTLLVWRLGRRWLVGFPALVPPFVYLASMPVMIHGGSFRSDSMLAPLTMAALVLLTTPGSKTSRDWLAGILLGAAFAVTVKAALFAPLIAALLIFRGTRDTPDGEVDWRSTSHGMVRVAVSAGISAALLLVLHWTTMSSLPTESVADFGTRTAAKTLGSPVWFPRIDYLRMYIKWQPLPWLLIAVGTMMALARRRFDLAALALALLPIAIYRNAFPYYYVMMLAPASVLAGFAVQEASSLVRKYSSEFLGSSLVAVIWLGLLYQGLAYAGRFRFDDQVNQRRLVSAVHQVFREPVNYIDRCGMISSFRKVNFFMSTWGMDGYRERNQPFMPAAIRDSRPAFVLVNSGNLNPDRPSSGGLLEEDYVLIDRFYPKYWGPLRVAGASAKLSGGLPTKLQVPFPGQYRLDADGPVVVDGVPRRQGDVINVPADGVSVQATAPDEPERETVVKLFLASAGPAPAEQLPGVPLFSGL